MRETVIIYHAECADGFAAAWLAKKKLWNAQFYPAAYSTVAPDVRDKDVFILDFCYPRSVLEQMVKDAATVTLIDHHETSVHDWDGIDRLHYYYNVWHSGAWLTQTFFNVQSSWVVDYVEDRDLWKWELPLSREVNAYLGTLPYEFEAWDAVAALSPETVAPFGAAILRSIKSYVDRVVRDAVQRDVLGHMVPVINAHPIHLSEVLQELGKGKPFAIGWHQRADGKFKYSLRSAPDGMHVGELAMKYGGGGHKHAAGFEVDYPIHFDPYATRLRHGVKLVAGGELKVELLPEVDFGEGDT